MYTAGQEVDILTEEINFLMQEQVEWLDFFRDTLSAAVDENGNPVAINNDILEEKKIFIRDNIGGIVNKVVAKAVKLRDTYLKPRLLELETQIETRFSSAGVAGGSGGSSSGSSGGDSGSGAGSSSSTTVKDKLITYIGLVKNILNREETTSSAMCSDINWLVL